MNRLLITILLVLAFAVSFAKFAFAQAAFAQATGTGGAAPTVEQLKKQIADRSDQIAKMEAAVSGQSVVDLNAPPSKPKKISHKTKPGTDTPATVTAPVASSPTGSDLPANFTTSDFCDKDEDNCVSEKLVAGKDKYIIKNSVDAKAKTMTAKVEKDEACHCGIIGLDPVTIDIPQGMKADDKAGFKALAQKTIAQAKEKLDAFNADKEAKDSAKLEIDTCQKDEEGKEFDVPTYTKSTKDDPIDYSEESLEKLDPIAACQIEKMEKLENSKDKREIKARAILAKDFEKRFTTLASKASLNPRDKAVLENILATDKGVALSVISKSMYDIAQKEQAYVVNQFTLATNAITAKDYFAANPFLARINLAKTKLFADTATADKLLSKGGLEDSDFQARAVFLDSILKNQNDFTTTTSNLSNIVAKNTKRLGSGLYSGTVAQTADAAGGATNGDFKYFLDKADKIALRSDLTSGSVGGLSPLTFEREPTSAQCFYNLNNGNTNGTPNCNLNNNNLSSPPNGWKLVGMGSGKAASSSATYNTAMTQAALQSNSLTKFSAGRNF